MENSSQGSRPGEIVFDTSSGFSVEEQQEILDKINFLNVEKGIVPEEGELKNEAKKKDHLFPLFVNIAAILFLCAGFFFLLNFHSRDDQDIREGSAVLGVTERRLIQEIRRETNNLLTEKEKEINDILSRLAAAGDEYRELELSVETLTAGQMERAEYLRNIQSEYQGALSTLQTDRAKILEDSRVRETRLRTQAEESVLELSGRIEESEANLTEAMGELARLSGEQDRAAAAEAQLGGYYAILDSQINAGQNGEAMQTLAAMKGFLENPVFEISRSMEARKQNQLAAITAFEKAVAASAGVPPPPPASNTEEEALREELASLENRLAEQDKTIAALSSSGSDQGRLIAEYKASVAELREATANHARSLAERDGRLTEMESAAAAKDQQITDITGALTESQERAAAAESENTNLRQQIETIRQLLQDQ